MNSRHTIIAFYGVPVVAAIGAIIVGIPIQNAHDRKVANALEDFRSGHGIMTCHYPGRALPGAAGYDLRGVPVSDIQPMPIPVAQYFEERIRSNECQISGIGEPERRAPPRGFGHSHEPGGAG